MRIIDISMPISEQMSVYKNKDEKRPKIETKQQANITETLLNLDAHTGTHIDAPLHIIPGGDTISRFHLEQLICPCRILDFSKVSGGISREDLITKEVVSGEFILLKTKNSFVEGFQFDFVYLKEDGAKYLAELPVMGVGIDALGIERDQPGHPTHKFLLEKSIPIIEGLRLKDAAWEGKYLLIAAPLSLVNTEAAPARVVLLETSYTEKFF